MSVIKEVEMCRKIQHPNIVSLLGAITTTTSVTLVTNLVRGHNLHSIIFDSTCAKVDEATLQAQIADFGLAKTLTGGATVGSRTMESGTPGFQAPEQLRAERVNVGCDVYAFGCVLIELYGEQCLWPNMNPFQIMCKVVVEKRKPQYEHLSAAVQQVVAPCLAERAERLTSAQLLGKLISLF